MLKRNLIFALAVGVYALLGYVAGFTCPIKALLGIPCPTCGVTRALCALCTLDIAGYFRFNGMALPLLLAVGLYVNIDFFSKRKGICVFTYLVLAVNLVYYIVRLMQH